MNKIVLGLTIAGLLGPMGPLESLEETELGTIGLVAAQTPKRWGLQECCDYAVSHNISIRQQENQRLQQEVQLSTARNQRLPDLSGSVGQNFSFGRGLTANNTYSNTNTSSTSFSLGTSVPLFTGFQIPNQIKLSQLNLEAATQDLEKAKNDIRMQVAQAYVQILYNQEILRVARRQVSIDSMQVVRIQAMVNNGKASGAELSQQKATMASSLLTATQADNNLSLSVLNLAQLLELPTHEGFEIRVPETVAVEKTKVSPDVVYAEALGIKPEIASQQLRLRAADYNIRIAKAGYLPTLTLNGGLGTNYYTASSMTADPFSTQIKNNFSQYIGLSLNVPIFNRFQTRNSVRTAMIEQQNQQLQLDNAKKTLYKEIQQVCLNTSSAQAKFESSKMAVQSSEDAFTLMQAKYENGKANITEFNESKNNYLRAESDCVQAQYELLYQKSLLMFYRGKPLDF
jgi:outer membrane protein